MYICALHQHGKKQWCLWVAALLLSLRSSVDRDGVREVLAGQDTVFNCTAQGQVDWRLQRQGADSSDLLSTCADTCNKTDDFKKLFIANVVNSRHSSSMTIKASNRSDIGLLLNASLQCVLTDGISTVNSSHCELNLVYPPEGVSCTAINTSWIVNVSCDIGSVYSSRGRYLCQLYRRNHDSRNETVEMVKMVTFPTSESTQGEVKVSGSCLFNTTLPVETGRYGFYVVIYPGGRTYNAKLAGGFEWITNEGPRMPTVSCSPHPYVLENTNVTCTCRTNSLGQPAGYLRWVIGNQTNQGQPARQEYLSVRSHEMNFTHRLTLSDHERTRFRCDVIRRGNETRGNIYTANVGYAAKVSRFSLNGSGRNQTVNDGDQVDFLCESDGLPSPHISIYRNNNTVIFNGSNVANYTFIARCEDTAMYLCSARNEFSHHVTTSLRLELGVLCKPRGQLSTHIGDYKIYTHEEVTFDIIAYPVPYEYHMWLVRSSKSSNTMNIDNIKDHMLNITCRAGKVNRYLSTCILTFVNLTSQSAGLYKVQIINEVGDGNFTIRIDFSVVDELEQHNSFAIVGVVSGIVVVFIFIVVIITLKKRRKKNAPLKTHIFEAEVTTGASQPEPCETPLYAVVDKTKKKRNQRPTSIVDKEKQMEKEIKQGIEGSEPSLPPTCQVVYAVVDKTKNKSAGKCDNFQTVGMDKRPKTENGRRKEVYSTEDSKCKSDDLGDYQNIMGPHSEQDEDYVQLDARSPASRSHTADDGRWLNSAGLLYTFPTFDVGNGVRCRPPPTHEETEYCTLRLMADAFPVIDRKSND
ncbi:uncharacterized protein LOC112568358 isoform X2 [Pomacea canaliculata]|uniref:uncharacterized protein LOC112568358 isoform X2 n=1 Tax=Pomacea canaliculata TaxID=400727 RepID=UPI000D73A785|nr:uncharacterized protein LOC112568358 isoform X2 [Pomacea canaliculata]